MSLEPIDRGLEQRGGPVLSQPILVDAREERRRSPGVRMVRSDEPSSPLQNIEEDGFGFMVSKLIQVRPRETLVRGESLRRQPKRRGILYSPFNFAQTLY